VAVFAIQTESKVLLVAIRDGAVPAACGPTGLSGTILLRRLRWHSWLSGETRAKEEKCDHLYGCHDRFNSTQFFFTIS